MSSAASERNVEGILHYMQDYFESREQQVIRINPRIEKIISDITWLHLQILKQVLQRNKAFGGEKYRVADVLVGADDAKRKALLSMSGDQSSIMDEILNRSDEGAKKSHDNTIHDMRTLFRSIDPSLECVVHLIQHWMKWDLGDAADLHHFDEQARRMKTLRSVTLSDDIRGRYRPALGKTGDQAVSDEDVFRFELRQLEVIAARFAARRLEDQPYELVVCRDEGPDGGPSEPYDYKARQSAELQARYVQEKQETDAKIGGGAGASQQSAAITL